MIDQGQSFDKANLYSLLDGQSLWRQGKHAEALAIFVNEAHRLGENPELLSMVAHCYFSIGLSNPNETGEDFYRAVEWMEKAIALAPRNGRLYAHLGGFYHLGLLDYEKAARAFRKSIRLNADDAATLYRAASLYGPPSSNVTLNEAIKWLNRAVEIEPDDANYHLRLAALYREAGRLLDFRSEMMKAILCPHPLDPMQVVSIRKMLESNEE